MTTESSKKEIRTTSTEKIIEEVMEYATENYKTETKYDFPTEVQNHYKQNILSTTSKTIGKG